MASLNEYLKQNFTPTVANEVEVLISLCVAHVLDCACNAIDNHHSSAGTNFAVGVIEPERIITEMLADFISMVQAPLSSRGTLQQQQLVGRGLSNVPGPARIIGYAQGVPITEADAPLYGHDPAEHHPNGFARELANRRRELAQPAAAPFGRPVVVATDQKDQDGNPIERLVHLTDEEFAKLNSVNFDHTTGVIRTDDVEAREKANFEAFDGKEFKKALDEDMRVLAQAREMEADDERNEADEDLQSLMDRDRE